MIEHQLTLSYRLAPGWMAPFVEGLRQGHAMGRRCQACARVSFPPLRTCPCGGTEADWIRLSGAAKILFRTDGTDGAFGLVRFEGADTNAVCQLEIGPDETGQLRPSDGPPQLRLGPKEEGQG